MVPSAGGAEGASPATFTGAPPELGDFAACLIAELEGARASVAGHLESLRVPYEDIHRLEWEERARRLEVADLQDQLKEATRPGPLLLPFRRLPRVLL